MNEFGNDFTTLRNHKTREQELIVRAENERIAKMLRNAVERPVRRALRINNNVR